MNTLNLNEITRRGTVANMYFIRPDGEKVLLGTIRGPRHSRGYRKHLRRMKQNAHLAKPRP